jgi:flavin-dependent dehydrogenase
MLLKEIDIGKSFIVQTVRGIKSILPDGSIKKTMAPGLMIRRDLFDQAMALKAEEDGAMIWLNTRALFMKGELVVVRKKDVEYKINAGIIIGADGPATRVGRWIDSENKSLIPAIQATADLVMPMDYTEVYFNREIFGGYGWLFPKGDKANIGIGKRKENARPVSIKRVLERFMARLIEEGKIRGKISGYTAGWIPAERVRNVVHGNIVLAGDAAGLTHPVSGAGVAQAVASGQMAGKWAARAIKSEDVGMLSEYDREWRELYGETQERAFDRRKLMEKEWGRLDDIIRHCWIAFKEYYV